MPGERQGRRSGLRRGSGACASQCYIANERTRGTPGWTLDLMARHSLDFWLTSEDLPEPKNRVTLDSMGGIVLSYQPNNEEGHKRLIAKLKGLLKQTTKCQHHG